MNCGSFLNVVSGNMFTCAFAVCVHNSKKGKILLQGTVVILDILNGLQSGAKLPLKLLYNQPGDAGYQLI